jgi:hypothetical protein
MGESEEVHVKSKNPKIGSCNGYHREQADRRAFEVSCHGKLEKYVLRLEIKFTLYSTRLGFQRMGF